MTEDPDRPVGEDDLQRFVDGWLPPERRDAVEAHLASHPDSARRIAAYRAQREALRAALQPLGEEPVPARLRLAALRQPPRRIAVWRAGPLRQLAASFGFVAFGGLMGWAARDLLAAPTAPEQPIAVGAHRVFVADRGRPVEIRAEAKEQLVQWLSLRLGRPVTIPDLGAAGLRFMGGRLLATPVGAAAQLMYDDDSGRRVTLFFEPEARPQQAPVFRQAQDVGALSWGDDRFAYTLAAPGERRWVASLGELVRRQISPIDKIL